MAESDPGLAPPAILPALEDLPRFETNLSVDEAYAAIPHRQTPFDFAASGLVGDEAAYLQVVFRLLDEAIRLRVTAYRVRIADHPRVTAASSALQRAYRALMKIYGAAEPAANRDAFFDVHCALDFL